MALGAVVLGTFMACAPLIMEHSKEGPSQKFGGTFVLSIPFFVIALGMICVVWTILRARTPQLSSVLDWRKAEGLTRFRFKERSPRSSAMSLGFLAGVGSHAWIAIYYTLAPSPSPLGAVAACFSAMVIVGAITHVMASRYWKTDRYDYVIDRVNGIFRFPNRPNTGRRKFPQEIRLQDVQAVLVRGSRVVAWAPSVPHGGSPLFGELLREHAFDAGQWIAGELGVPLLEPSKAEARRMFRAQFPVLWHWLPAMAYLLLLGISFGYRNGRGARNEAPVPEGVTTIAVPAIASDGRAKGADISLAFHEWNHDATGVPVLLLHGSPGTAGDFDRLGPLLDKSRRVISPDMLGYGGTRGKFQDRSIEAYARTMLAFLDRLHIQRVHVVGWSNGGGVALHMADLAPDRVASLTMLASIGLQEHEPSGSYFFEHFKYKAAKVIVGVLPELIPHFGLLGTYDQRTAWASFFDDSDQRKLLGVMERIGERATPTLILHGRHDFLVPAFAAEDHYRLITSSRLVMLDASHFIPFLQEDEASAILNDWFTETDMWEGAHAGTPNSLPWRGIDDRSPSIAATWVHRESDRMQDLVRLTPWWIQILAGAVIVALWPTAGVVLGTLLVVRCSMDPFILLTGMLLGFWAHPIVYVFIGWWRAPAALKPRHAANHPFAEGWASQFVTADRARTARHIGESLRGSSRPLGMLLTFALGRTLGVIAWCLVAMVVANIVEATWTGPMRRWFGGGGAGAFGLLVTLVAIYLAVVITTSLFSRAGRRHMLVSFERLLRHEYWPTWAFYIPIYPYFLFHAFRNGGVRQVTCCNPEIEHGGGWAGESKFAIMEKLQGAGPIVLATHLVPSMPTPGERVEMLRSLMRQHPAISTLPIVLKPNEAQRGFGFKLLRSMDQAEAYFTTMTAAVVVQPYHAGPEECGIFWMRYTAAQRASGVGPNGRPVTPGRLGFIYSITRKEFPSVLGDGARTLEKLVRKHPRYRRQAAVFLERFANERSRTPATGEVVRLGVAGNHFQGTLFRDGSDLITEELEAEVDRIAAAFPRLDYGRFDTRFTSEAELKTGRGLAIIELNGASAEPTNMYDPERSYAWAMGVLARMWRQVIELAKERRAEGVPPMTVPEFVRVIRMNADSLKGNAVAD